MKSTMNGGEQALHGLAPKLNGLAPKRANSASVRRRKTNNPSLESLSSCWHEELAIDSVRAPRATQAVLEPGAIIHTLKVPTVAPYSSMQAWIGVKQAGCLEQGFNEYVLTMVDLYCETRYFVEENPLLTRWVPCDGYICHQNDHLSGRMTDIFRHGWMTSCGRRRDSATPECFGRGSQGTIFVRSSKYIFSFQRYVHFEEFFVSRAFVRFGAERSSAGAFGFDDFLELFLETPLGHRASFCELRLRPWVFFENFLSFFKAQPVLLAWQLWWSPGWTKHFGDDTSKIRMKTSFPGVGEIERRRTVVIGTSHLQWIVIHGPKEKKNKQGSQRVIVRSLNPSSSTNQRVLKNLFPRPNIATVLHFAVFMYVDVQLQVGQAAAKGQQRKAVIRDISGVDHRRATNLSASIWFTGERYCTVHSVFFFQNFVWF